VRHPNDAAAAARPVSRTPAAAPNPSREWRAGEVLGPGEHPHVGEARAASRILRPCSSAAFRRRPVHISFQASAVAHKLSAPCLNMPLFRTRSWTLAEPGYTGLFPTRQHHHLSIFLLCDANLICPIYCSYHFITSPPPRLPEWACF